MGGLYSCTKFVAVEPPKSVLLGELVFEEPGTTEAALAAIYTQLRDDYGGLLYGGLEGMNIILAQYADELESHSSNGVTGG